MPILSIQSHVAYGHVGNRSAVFPLERMGFEVWPVNTVQFSNHTGYGAWRGEIFPGSHIDEVWMGVRELGVAGDCEAVLSGYLGDVSIGRSILSALADVRKANPRAIYCCDPVMGDFGRGIYVRPDIPSFFLNEVLPAADIVTPNLFEAEILSDMKISTLENAAKACMRIHKAGPRIIVITSFTHEPQKSAPTASPRPDDSGTGPSISMLLSHAGCLHMVTTPELAFDCLPNGAGDLGAALFLGHFLETRDARRAFEAMTEGVYSVFERTKAAGARELRIVQSQDAFVTGRRRFRSVEVFPSGRDDQDSRE